MSKAVGMMIGNGFPESTEAARDVLEAVGDFTFRDALIGEAAIDDTGDPLPLVSRRVAKASHAILLGPLHRPEWEADPDAPAAAHPYTALDTLVKTIDARAYVQPVRSFDALADLSPRRRGNPVRVDLLLVHALDPDHADSRPPEEGDVYDFEYSREEIGDVARIAFELARIRGDETSQQPYLASFDTSSAIKMSPEWSEIMDALKTEEFTDVRLEHMLADNPGREIDARPMAFDVLVGDSLFGDSARDVTAAMTAPGLLPAGLLSPARRGIYMPAQDEGVDNVYGSVMAAAAALRYSLDMPHEAGHVEDAVGRSLADGVRTPDLGGDAAPEDVTAAILGNLRL